MLDSNFVKYTLQLNLYKYIMETEGYVNETIEELILLHIRPKTTKPYEVEHEQDAIKAILQHRRDKEVKKDVDHGI
jgi:hypothetical protein